MLKKRIITAVFLLVLFLSSVFHFPNFLFAIFLAVIILVAAWEWAGLLHLEKKQTTLYLLMTSLLLVGAWWLARDASLYIYLISALWWAIAALWVMLYPKHQYWAKPVILSGLGWLTLIPAWIACVKLQADQSMLLLYGFVIIWGGDTGAYFVGRKWGRNKLAPFVSPGKTIEGFCGGLFTSFLFVFILIYFFGFPVKGVSGQVFIIAVTFLAAVFGDLFESMVKRWSGKKDSSNILPGHGGVLDRIDAVCSAMPIFVLSVYLMAD